jgi:putative hydrolase of the HAD superfamily
VIAPGDEPPTPRVLCFDLDDTLWAVGPVIAAAERLLLDWLRAHHPDVARDHGTDSMRTLRAAVARDFPERAHDVSFLRRTALERQFAAAGHTDTHAAERAFEVFYAARNRVVFYPDVLPALERLRRRYRLFALSNGNADLHRCGIGGLFEGHVTAQAVGAAKPDARIFGALVRLTGVPAGAIVHVGDDPEADVVGARNAGLDAIWVNRAARAWPAEFAGPTRIVTTLEQLD